MGKINTSILFLGKEKDKHTKKALKYCRENFSKVIFYLGKWGDPMPQDLKSWEGDYIISYLSRWVVTNSLLKNAKIAAINFHPGSPEYPGIGCNNFALYENAKEYGVTCHYMSPTVDTGPIIDVKRFPIVKSDTVESLLLRTYDYQLKLFYKIMKLIRQRKALPESKEKWAREPFTRKEFDQLKYITFDMSKEEIDKRIKAATFGPYKPVIELNGYIFEFKGGNDKKN